MIKVLKPRLSSLPPKLKTTREIRDKRYSADATVRSWYHSARWQKLREAVLIRDLYTCQHTGVILTTGRTEPSAAVVHHKTPHKGDEHLFWDISNLEAVSKEWHDSEAQKEERRQP
ncbi:HNH endonuclease [Devosia sp. MC521]|uniref:HNH endonuclease n=1 Tax=Devosia sp. MC521 TaxID=2759954 RepID=UPI0015F7F442|nr:HNH endonuclease [Devosia sp. MC521]QMW63955.1 HNH endonuclease [Devosia sp. MC521]